MVEAADTASPAKSEVPSCVMNDEVKDYEPTLDDIFFIIPSGDY